MNAAATHLPETVEAETPRALQLEAVITAGARREVRDREWREMLVDAAGGDRTVAALRSARLLAADPDQTLGGHLQRDPSVLRVRQ